jgi:outer membrane protein
MKPGKALMICYAVVSMSLNSMAQNTPLTLQQCVETAIANNVDVKTRDFQSQRERVNAKQGRDNLIPTLSGNIDHNLNTGRSINPYTNAYVEQTYSSATYSASTDVTLFNGWRLLNNLKSVQFAYEASRMELQQQKDKLMLDVILAYLQILTNEDLLDQARKQLAVSSKQVERLDIMNKEGAIKPADLYDLKGQYADNQITITNIRNNLNSAKLSLAQLMNLPYREDLQVQKLDAAQFGMDYTASTEDIFKIALEQLSIIKGVELRQKSAEKAVASTRGRLSPTIGFGAGVNTNFSSLALDANDKKIQYYSQLKNNYRLNAGVGINIPILNNWRVRNQLALDKINLKEAEYTAQTTHIQLRQNIERDHFNMDASLNKYKVLVDQVSAYTETFRAAEVRFNEGASTSVDYLIAKNNLDRANINLIIARYDYVLRTKILDYYQAKMLW